MSAIQCWNPPLSDRFQGTGTSHPPALGCGSDDWIRDVTFKEDSIKTKAGNQAQVMGLLHGLAIELIRKTWPKNFQSAIEKFMDSAHALESCFLQVKFL